MSNQQVMPPADPEQEEILRYAKNYLVYKDQYLGRTASAPIAQQPKS